MIKADQIIAMVKTDAKELLAEGAASGMTYQGGYAGTDFIDWAFGSMENFENSVVDMFVRNGNDPEDELIGIYINEFIDYMWLITEPPEWDD